MRLNYRGNFIASALLEGYILHVRHLKASPGRLIQKCLGSWGAHDGLCVRTPAGMTIGESVPLRSRLTPLHVYEDQMASGSIEVKILRPAFYSRVEGRVASNHARLYLNDKLYNFAAYPLLAIKCLLGDAWDWSADLEWADWCTEYAMDAWLAAGKDYWRKPGDNSKRIRPTPLTTEHRLEEGVFIDVTHECLNPF